MKKKNIRIIAVAFIGILFVGVISSMSYIRNLPVDYDAGACGGGYATFIFDKYNEELVEKYYDGMADNSNISSIKAIRGTQEAQWEDQTIFLQFDVQYGFEDYTMKITPDPLEGTAGIGSYGFQYHGLDGDGTALFLIKHDYVSRNGVTEDNRPLDIILTLTNFVQNKNAETDKLLTEGEWNLKFTLDRSQFPATMELPDTEVQLQNLKTKEDVAVTFSNIELTCTGLRFQYDYQGGIIGTVDQITVLLENGATIGISSGGGYPLADGTLNCSYQWQIPINIDEVSKIQIGNTQIDIPK